MNVAQAKRLPIIEILAALGCQPEREDRAKGEIWYPSPFRVEGNASFKISLSRNVWYDFGEGEGGNVLDFAVKYFRTDVRGALRELSRLNLGTLLEPVATATAMPKRAAVKPALPAEGETEPDMEITKMQPLQNRALAQYLERRGIPAETAAPYVQEMYYCRGGKPYFALAFANDSGGYELRNPYFKGVTGPKDITLLMKRKSDGQAVAVFEGFMDMLSARCLYAKELEDTALLVLNSTATQDKAIAAIRDMGAQRVHLFLDRDDSGRQAAEKFRAQLAGIEVIDESGRYDRSKDLNEWLVAQQGRDR